MTTPSTTYPRPDWTRPNLTWTSLNGPWTFTFDDKDTGLSQAWHKTSLKNASPTHRQIQVPFAFQTRASGINLQEAHEVIWYEREITDIRTPDQLTNGNRLLLRFGAVDYECEIWVDGHYVGGHRGGHVPFDVDISDAVTSGKTARLTLRVRDSPTDLCQPRGKQYWGPVPESIFYTPTSGIWQNVWMESVPRARIADGSGGTVLRANDLESGKLHTKIAVAGRRVGVKYTADVEASLDGRSVSRWRCEMPADKNVVGCGVPMNVPFAGELKTKAPFNADGAWSGGVALWAPEHSILYDLTIRLYDGDEKLVDEVHTTTGMRSLSWQNGDGTFRLNGKPYFQVLCLDQGFWPETGLTPPSSEALKEDIVLSKAIGLNGCRKHQKVEDPAFYYWADRLGYLVWGEMANAYEFGDEFVDRMNEEWMASVRRDINHPSIVTWTPGNESWGWTSLKDNIQQRNHVRSLYYMTKTLDPTRPINDNCGWEHVMTDLTTYHDYSDSAELAATSSSLEGILGPKAGHDMFTRPIHSSSGVLLDQGASHKPGAPVICSEMGGVNIAPAKEVAAGERDWGYTTASNAEDFLVRLEKLIMAVAKGGHCCGTLYTQFCDIEQEVNGFYTYDRKEKVPAARIKAILDGAKEYYFKNVLPK